VAVAPLEVPVAVLDPVVPVVFAVTDPLGSHVSKSSLHRAKFEGAGHSRSNCRSLTLPSPLTLAELEVVVAIARNPISFHPYFKGCPIAIQIVTDSEARHVEA
jgi:hypothetical protein